MRFVTVLALVAGALLALAACSPAAVPSSAPTTAAQGLATVTAAVGNAPALGPTETATVAASSTAPASAPTIETTPTSEATSDATAAATSAATSEATSAAPSAATSAAPSAATSAATSVAGPEPAQTITVVGAEFAFDPNQLTLKVGQRVRIVFENKGTVDHEFEVEELKADNVALDLSQAGNIPEDERDEAMGDATSGAVHEYAAAGGTATIDFTPTTAGTYNLVCGLPGHKEQGMEGTLVVEP